MLKPKSRWKVQQADETKINELVKQLNITPLVASLLVNRNIDDVEAAKSFLFLQENDFHDPFLFTGMDQAVERIQRAIQDEEKILIFGDYDADGVTSTSVLMVTLQELGADVQFYIPDRFTEGYGPNEGAFRRASEEGISLIITVDTGIAGIHEANVAKELGMDLIITDHHEPGPELPEAIAIIHPKLPGSTYPFHDLAGVGVAFKLAHALRGEIPTDLLDLVAIGTIADLVPLRGENRLIVKSGLDVLKRTDRIGIRQLLSVARKDISEVNEDVVGFTIAPRLNAVGRLQHAKMAVDLLLTDDENEGAQIAKQIEELNVERQKIVNDMVQEAIEEVEKLDRNGRQSVIVVGKEGWNQGVIGIVASKLVEKYYRPVICFSFDEENGLAKGSGRSIEGFDLFKNLSTCRDILPHFGGHPMAAGMTLSLSDVDELRERLNKLADEQLTEEDFIPVTFIDGVTEIKEIDLETIEEINMLSPFGVTNPKPKILLKDANISQIRKIGANQDHLKVILEKDEYFLDGVGFGLGAIYDHVSQGAKLSVIGELTINEWNNVRKPQIFLHDVAVFEWQLFDYRGTKHYNQLKEHVDDALWIVFHKKYTNVSKNTFLVETNDEAKQLDLSGRDVVLFDFPPSKEILENLFFEKNPARIYAHFYKEETDFFQLMPSRDHFKWYYAFLLKNSPFDLNRFGSELAKYRGWKKEMIEFMSQVFLELDFITNENGFISINKNVSKKDLFESPTYRKKKESYELETELLYSKYEQLKSLFDSLMTKSPKLEEAVLKWI